MENSPSVIWKMFSRQNRGILTYEGWKKKKLPFRGHQRKEIAFQMSKNQLQLKIWGSGSIKSWKTFSRICFFLKSIKSWKFLKTSPGFNWFCLENVFQTNWEHSKWTTQYISSNMNYIVCIIYCALGTKCYILHTTFYMLHVVYIYIYI